MTRKVKTWNEISTTSKDGRISASDLVPSRPPKRQVRVRPQGTDVSTPSAGAHRLDKPALKRNSGKVAQGDYSECIAYKTDLTYVTDNATGPRGIKKFNAYVVLSPENSVHVAVYIEGGAIGKILEATKISEPRGYSIYLPSDYGIGKYVCRFETYSYYEVLQAGLRALGLGQMYQ